MVIYTLCLVFSIMYPYVLVVGGKAHHKLHYVNKSYHKHIHCCKGGLRHPKHSFGEYASSNGICAGNKTIAKAALA